MARGLAYLSVDRKGRATLPEEVRRELGLEEGDLVLLERTDRGTYELVPAAIVPKDQLWFHHPSMRRRVAQAEEDLREGRVSRTASPEEAESLLDSLKRSARGKRG